MHKHLRTKNFLLQFENNSVMVHVVFTKLSPIPTKKLQALVSTIKKVYARGSLYTHFGTHNTRVALE